MSNSDWSESVVLAEWAEYECRHLDLIASWEALLAAYSALGFEGPSNDEERLAEFKLVITELNKFLTRMRNGLNKADSIESAIAFLSLHANTSDMNSVRNRANIAYNKMKQQWISQSISMLLGAIEDTSNGGERDE